MTTAMQSLAPALVEARRAVYCFLRAALDKPTTEQHAWLASDRFRRQLIDVASVFGIEPPTGDLVPDKFPDHEARYLACFEVGLPEPPVVLLASHYHRRAPVTAIIHEHKLYYQWFAANGRMDNQEPADHLLNELIFLIHLDDLLLNPRRDEASVVRARRDFVHRHVARWVPHASAAANENHIPHLYRTLLAILAAAIGHDQELTEEAILTINTEENQ
ncbi:MAG: molecular chaperone TorD family protein [Gemmataceae bacterium]